MNQNLTYYQSSEFAKKALQEVVMRAYNPAHIGPLVAGTKPNNKYESFEARIHALVQGLRVS